MNVEFIYIGYNFVNQKILIEYILPILISVHPYDKMYIVYDETGINHVFSGHSFPYPLVNFTLSISRKSGNKR